MIKNTILYESFMCMNETCFTDLYFWTHYGQILIYWVHVMENSATSHKSHALSPLSWYFLEGRFSCHGTLKMYNSPFPQNFVIHLWSDISSKPLLFVLSCFVLTHCCFHSLHCGIHYDCRVNSKMNEWCIHSIRYLI